MKIVIVPAALTSGDVVADRLQCSNTLLPVARGDNVGLDSIIRAVGREALGHDSLVESSHRPVRIVSSNPKNDCPLLPPQVSLGAATIETKIDKAKENADSLADFNRTPHWADGQCESQTLSNVHSPAFALGCNGSVEDPSTWLRECPAGHPRP